MTYLRQDKCNQICKKKQVQVMCIISSRWIVIFNVFNKYTNVGYFVPNPMYLCFPRIIQCLFGCTHTYIHIYLAPRRKDTIGTTFTFMRESRWEHRPVAVSERDGS